MTSLPDYRPKKLSLGSWEREILEIVWELGSVTVKEVHERILLDPDRDLAYASVTTVLKRLMDKGWLVGDRQEKSFIWRPLISRQQAEALEAYEQLQKFLAISNPDFVAGFVDSLDRATIEQIEAIARTIKAFRQTNFEQEKFFLLLLARSPLLIDWSRGSMLF